MPTPHPTRSTSTAIPQGHNRTLGLLGLAAVMATGLMLSGCNTTAGAGRDVSATGNAITRGANDVKTGL